MYTALCHCFYYFHTCEKKKKKLLVRQATLHQKSTRLEQMRGRLAETEYNYSRQ